MLSLKSCFNIVPSDSIVGIFPVQQRLGEIQTRMGVDYVQNTDLDVRIIRKQDPARLPSLLDVFQQLLPPPCICVHTSNGQEGQKLTCRALAFLWRGIIMTGAGHENGEHRILCVVKWYRTTTKKHDVMYAFDPDVIQIHTCSCARCTSTCKASGPFPHS